VVPQTSQAPYTAATMSRRIGDRSRGPCDRQEHQIEPGSVGHRADICARGFYISRMAHYTFRIRQGAHSSDVPIDLLDDDAAWDEAAAACSDMIRDTIARLGDSPEWRLEVADASGTIRHLFRLTAETFGR